MEHPIYSIQNLVVYDEKMEYLSLNLRHDISPSNNVSSATSFPDIVDRIFKLKVKVSYKLRVKFINSF